MTSSRDRVYLAAPQARDGYYADYFDRIVAFQAAVASALVENGDEAIVIADGETLPLIAERFPGAALVEGNLPDIWIRDYAAISRAKSLGGSVLFRYSATAQDGKPDDARYVRDAFRKIAEARGFRYVASKLVLDGGNVVDNGAGSAIVTTRFLEDNALSEAAGRECLRDLLGLESVAFVPCEAGDVLGHADGIAAFLTEDLVAVSAFDEPFRSQVRSAIERALPRIEIVELPLGSEGEAHDRTFPSAAGIYVNLLATRNAKYLPTYRLETDRPAAAIVATHSRRKVISVDASGIAELGGSLRCMTWPIVM